MAAGSHLENGIWALLVIPARRMQMQIVLMKWWSVIRVLNSQCP